jgi:hypothetical protein
MYVGYEMIIDEPHELCQWALEDIEKCYNDSCKKAIKDIYQENKRRQELIEKANLLGKALLKAYDEDDRETVANLLREIKSNMSK